MSNFEIKFTNGLPIEKSNYPKLDERQFIVKAGSVQKDGARPLPCDVLIERDTPVKLRDGVTIRVDVYRPTDKTDCPVVMWYAPYGKRGNLNYDTFGHPTRMDIPREWEDGLNSFEAPVPSYWVSHGYAVVSPDPRGVGYSEGNVHAWGSQEAKDEYDLIEWAAGQDWSNGKVGLSGNSYLAMSQYAVASIKPPHLAAIAPWEGAFNPYKETLCRGGIADMSFHGALTQSLCTNGKVEDVGKMMAEHPFYDEYWADKEPNIENADVPAYFVSSWTNVLHSSGTIEAYEKIGSKDKWLRVHNTHEWHDYNTPEHVEDLRRFFDKYLKGIDNGWDKTPKVRLTVLNHGSDDIIDRPENEFPPKNGEIKTYYLHNDNTLSEKNQASEASVSYDATNTDGVKFTIKLNEDAEFVGHGSLRLWVEADGNDDMDIYAYVRKIKSDGSVFEPQVVTDRYYPGQNGQLRVSKREIDKKLSTSLNPVLTLKSEQKLSKGEIVPIDIPLWPFGMKWEKGETIELQVCPECKILRPEFPDMPPAKTLNKGRHILHIGGKYDARLKLWKLRN